MNIREKSYNKKSRFSFAEKRGETALFCKKNMVVSPPPRLQNAVNQQLTHTCKKHGFPYTDSLHQIVNSHRHSSKYLSSTVIKIQVEPYTCVHM